MLLHVPIAQVFAPDAPICKVQSCENEDSREQRALSENKISRVKRGSPVLAGLVWKDEVGLSRSSEGTANRRSRHGSVNGVETPETRVRVVSKNA